MTVRVRFAPSPTGFLHVGGARTALFCWLQARHTGGQLVLRIEDTDRERSTHASGDAILDGLKCLDLTWDEGPYFQTERMDRYGECIDRLLEQGDAYHCYCTREELEAMREEQRQRGDKARYDGRCRERSAPREGVSPVVRFKNPLSGEVVVDDAVRGRMVFANAELDDLIIARGDGTPTYNLTVVVDDVDMRITHVIRGDDHINNTPRQMNILAALGAEPPVYAHLPMILGPDGQRLSKRHGAVSVLQFRHDGFLPDALVNYLVRLGWSHGDQEIFSREEMVGLFDVTDVNRAAAVFDNEKLKWVNQHYIQQADSSELVGPLREQLELLGLDPSSGPDLEQAAQAQRDRAKTLVEMAEKSRFAYADFDDFDESAARKHLRPVTLEPLKDVLARLEAVSNWEAETLHGVVAACAEALELNLGKIAQPLRVALTGSAASPSIEITLTLVGRERALSRIEKAVAYVTARAAAA
ncbi:MAG: glutamate--tRNA ligase [Gammaproteobacteria bacterium]